MYVPDRNLWSVASSTIATLRQARHRRWIDAGEEAPQAPSTQGDRPATNRSTTAATRTSDRDHTPQSSDPSRHRPRPPGQPSKPDSHRLKRKSRRCRRYGDQAVTHPRGRERLVGADRRLSGRRAAGRPLAEILIIPGQGFCALPARYGTESGTAETLVAALERDRLIIANDAGLEISRR